MKYHDYFFVILNWFIRLLFNNQHERLAVSVLTNLKKYWFLWLLGDITIGTKTVIHPKAKIIAESGPIIIGK